ncbi:MAG TPA: hypothetical protein DCM87_03415 [Planctomycetes bacterium]|nr:hypothetical protein [Planctomycetota bacterium]
MTAWMAACRPSAAAGATLLVGGAGYVPTPEAVRGGGYSAIVQSNTVGPEGGQMLVERTVELINGLWPSSP